MSNKSVTPADLFRDLAESRRLHDRAVAKYQAEIDQALNEAIEDDLDSTSERAAMKAYVQREVAVEAVQFHGNADAPEIAALGLSHQRDGYKDVLLVPTPSGATLQARDGDWIVRSPRGALFYAVLGHGTFLGNFYSADDDGDADLTELRADLDRIVRLVHARHAHWWQDPATGTPIERNVGELLMLIVSELAEGMEGHRKSLMDDKLSHRPMLEVELADAVIRIFDAAGGLKLDLAGAVAEKLAYNAVRADHKPENRLKPGGKKY